MVHIKFEKHRFLLSCKFDIDSQILTTVPFTRTSAVVKFLIFDTPCVWPVLTFDIVRKSASDKQTLAS
jgi:hypothetical protein